MNRFTILALLLVSAMVRPLAADTYDERTLVLIQVPDKAERQFILSSRIDVTGAGPDWVKALLRKEEFRLLEDRGLIPEILYKEMEEDRALWREADAAAATLAPGFYYTPSKFNTTNPASNTLMKHLLDLHNAHPDITRLYDIGNSYSGAYDILAIKVTKNPDVVEAEPKIRIYGNIHGDEKGGLMVACEALDWILANYPADPSAQKLVDESELWFIPMGNPDGNNSNSRYNGHNVDLNRNFWGPAGSSDGTGDFSEPETQAIRDLTETTTADHSKKRFTTSLSFHGGATCFNSLWNYTTTPTTDEPIFFTNWTGGPQGQALPAPNGLAKAYQDGCTTSGFWYTNGANWYVTNGDTNDWSYGQWSDLDTTLEVTAVKTPPVTEIAAYVAEHRQATINYMLKTFQNISGVMTDQATGAPLDGTVAATCTASASIPVPHTYQAIFTDPVAGDFHRVLQPGTYTVTCSAAGYTDLVVPNVVVTADATTTINCAMAGPCANNPSAVSVTPAGPLTQCTGMAQLLTATPTGGVGTTYQWYDGGNPIAGATSFTYSANAAGTHTYTCKATGSGCASGIMDATPTQITWTTAPDFAGLTGITNPAGATCALNLTWSTGTARCSGPLTYNVYRSTSTGFTPGPANRIASGVSATTYQDMDQLTYNTTYYYVVRAVDTSNSTEETNVIELSGKPTGPMSPGTFTAGAESGDPSLVLNAPWATSTTYKRTGTNSYSTGATYPNSACGALTTAPLVLGTNPVLTFYHIYSTETGWDGGRVEISTNGGSSWGVLTPTPAYPASITSAGNSCSWPTSTACYIGNSTSFPAAWQLATIALSAYSGQTVLLRWNFTSDGSGMGTGANAGWYIDDIQITNVNVPSACATSSNCVNNPTQLSVTPDGPLTLCAGTAQLLTATPAGGVGTTYQWYDGASPIGGATASTYSANTTATHNYNCQAKGTGCSSAMSDASPTQITWQAEPTFAGLTSVTNPGQATCRLDLAWSAGSTPCAGGITYTVYRSTTPAFTPAAGNRIALGVIGTSYQDSNGLANGTTYYYKTRAVTVANGTEETNVVERSGAPSGAGSSSSTLFSESFDGATFPPTGWTTTVVGSSSTPAAWARVTTSTNPTGINPQSGAAMAEFNSYHAQNGGSNRLARTANLNIAAGVTSASAVLWVYHETSYSGYTDQIQVQTSPDGTTWTNRGTAINRYDGSTGWKEHTIDLSALIGAGNFRIGYLGVSAYGNDTYLDDVSVSTITIVACTTGSAAPPPVKDTGANAVRFTKGSGNTLNVTYDAASCSAQKVVILYNTIGTWTGYAGCALDAGGNGGSTSFDSGVSTNRWYNLVWTQGTTAGHPGFATSGARTWNVGTLCGMTTDDKSHSTCP